MQVLQLINRPAANKPKEEKEGESGEWSGIPFPPRGGQLSRLMDLRHAAIGRGTHQCQQ